MEISEVAAATWFVTVVATMRLVAVATVTAGPLTSGWQSTDLTCLELIVTPFLLGIQCFEWQRNKFASLSTFEGIDGKTW
jgi:hypothetical protein